MLYPNHQHRLLLIPTVRTAGSGYEGAIDSDPSLITICATLLPSHPLSRQTASIDLTNNASTDGIDNGLDNHLLQLWFGTQTESYSDNLDNDKTDVVDHDMILDYFA